MLRTARRIGLHARLFREIAHCVSRLETIGLLRCVSLLGSFAGDRRGSRRSREAVSHGPYDECVRLVDDEIGSERLERTVAAVEDQGRARDRESITQPGLRSRRPCVDFPRAFRFICLG